MKKKSEKTGQDLSLDDLLADATPLSETESSGLGKSIGALESDVDHITEMHKAVFVEDVLRALHEDGISKTDLAKKLGKTRQQVNRMLNENCRNNFTIDTMVKVSIALGRKPVIRMPAVDEKIIFRPSKKIEMRENSWDELAGGVRRKSDFSLSEFEAGPTVCAFDLNNQTENVA